MPSDRILEGHIHFACVTTRGCRLSTALADNARLREALRFYADGETDDGNTALVALGLIAEGRACNICGRTDGQHDDAPEAS